MKNITRYMSLEKCLDVVTNGRLYIARFDSFDDQLEGHTLTQLADKAGIVIQGLEEEKRNKLDPDQRKKVLFGSCWFSGGENLSMWDRFRAERGLAISLSKESLIEKFTNSSKANDFKLIHDNHGALNEPEISDTYYGAIKYVSNRTQKKDSSYRLGLFKHSAFKHEKEFRLVVRQKAKIDQVRATGILWNIPKIEDLDFTIYTNPYMDSSFTKMVKSYFSELNLKNIKVSKSKFRSLFTK